MSANERPELRAFKELETLVRHLGEELAAFRRRAIAAEAQLKDAQGGGSKGSAGRGAASSGRTADLEIENEVLKTRLARSEERVRQIMERVRFLRQQLQSQAPAAGAAGGR
jgi:predicted  nucleic acid-binding Zn-ribbon protein